MSTGPMGDDAWIKAERYHEREMEDIRSKEAWRVREYRKEVLGWVVMGTVAVLIVGIVVFALWRYAVINNNNSTKRQVACTEQGGSYVPIQNGPTLCLFTNGGLE